MSLKSNITVISLGGSLIIPKSGFDIKFLLGFKKMILDFVKKGYRFVIVCGGGGTARSYQSAARQLGEISAEDVDWIGIHATRLNAHLMRTVFCKLAHPVVIKNPTQKTNWKEKILIASGWKPGFSTDFDAVKLAELYGAKIVINFSNIDYVYDKDPKKFKGAKRIEEGNWTEFRKIVGNKWSPGANLPFDPVASKEAQKLNLIVKFVGGVNLVEARKAVAGLKFKGTTIK